VNRSEQILALYREAALGNTEVFAFLLAFHGWAHTIDDLVDDPAKDRIAVVDVGMRANVLFSCPFYQRNAAALQVVVALVADAYRTSVDAERKGGSYARLADSLRLAGNQMVLAVAMIVGGWEHMQRISAQLWPLAWESQHEPTAIIES